ncbi:MAG: prolipoprotein diacylglyceryl transferase, partial [Paludibacteraceae bacterium]|nr:prolipoprotein diacylglyceryl transferase [Paludibacteraceae bacterium]
MNQLLYIVWNPDLVAFRLGPLSVRWYGLMWAIGIALAFLVVKRLYKEQKIKDELFAPLYIYCFFGILIGARLGHCLFYEPNHFLTSGKGFVEMFLPIRFLADGGWKYVGYQGLAYIAYDITLPDAATLARLLATSVAVKERIVTEDPHEHGIRKALNLG